MAYTVTWSARSKSTYSKSLEYLKKKWPKKVLSDFMDKTDQAIIQIKEHPKQGTASIKYKNTRKILITEHTYMFYLIKTRKKEIRILLFWDNKMNPSKLKY